MEIYGISQPNKIRKYCLMPVKNVITDFCYIVHANSKSENTFSLADILFVHAQAAARHI